MEIQSLAEKRQRGTEKQRGPEKREDSHSMFISHISFVTDLKGSFLAHNNYVIL